MKGRGRKIFVGVLAAIFAWLCGVGYVIWSFGETDAARPSDCAIVLGAAAYDTRPSPVFEERLRHAIDLHQRGIVRKIVFTGGFGDGAKHAESEVGAAYAARAGLPAADLLTEKRSRTTWENLVEAKAVMAANGLRSAILVSDPPHLKRAAMMAEDVGISAVASATPTSRYRSAGARFQFLLREIYFVHHYYFVGE